MRTNLALVSVATILCGSLFGQNEKQFAVQGRVVDDDSSQPVAKVRVQLSGGRLPIPTILSTDEQGRFSFLATPAQKYRLRFEKAGYFNLDYGRDIYLDAKDSNLGDISLTPKRSISGVIRWSNGDPAEGAIAVAIRVRGASLGAQSRASEADDRGQFRIGDLQPGRYVVYAMSQGLVGQNQIIPATVPVFYPGSRKPDITQAIDLRHIGEAAGPLVFTLEETQGVIVSGIVESGNATPVSMALAIPDVPTFPFLQSAAVTPGNRFWIPGVPAGSYYLVAHTNGPPATIALTALPISVFNAPLENLHVTVPPKTKIEGTVRIDEVSKDTRGNPLAGVRLSTLSERFRIFSPTVVKALDANGQFEFGAAMRGEPFLLEIQNLPQGYYVASVTQAGKELATSRLLVKASDDDGPVNIVLKNDSGTIKGTVFRSGQPATKGFVVLAPKQREVMHRYRTANIAEDGSYSLSGIAPGEYSLLALERNYDDEYLDPCFLEAQSRGVRTIQITANGSLAYDLDAIELR